MSEVIDINFQLTIQKNRQKKEKQKKEREEHNKKVMKEYNIIKTGNKNGKL